MYVYLLIYLLFFFISSVSELRHYSISVYIPWQLPFSLIWHWVLRYKVTGGGTFCLVFVFYHEGVAACFSEVSANKYQTSQHLILEAIVFIVRLWEPHTWWGWSPQVMKRKHNSFSLFQPYLLKQQGVSIWHLEHTE
jgi:uncharacterized membrane protein